MFGLHEWDALELIVVNGFDDGMFWLTEKSLMHILYLILKVWKGMHIMCCMLGLLLGRYLQVMLCNGIVFGCWCRRIDWKAP